MPPAPPHFPFTIEDNPGAETIILKGSLLERKFMYLYCPHISAKRTTYDQERNISSSSSDDDSNDENTDRSSTYSNNDDDKKECCVDPLPRIWLDVVIKKLRARSLTAFELRVSASADAMEIHRITLEGMTDPDGDYQTYGSYILESGTDLHPALKRFIEIREITLTNAWILVQVYGQESHTRSYACAGKSEEVCEGINL